jgi:hypothetical protein
VDLGQVLGLRAGEAQALLNRAKLNLERALAAEVLARRGHPCPDRAEVLAGWSGTMTPGLRDRVLEHAFGCEACAEARPRNVSAARVFSLLPAPALSPQARAELIGSLTAPLPGPPGPPVDLPLAALVQPPPSVTPLTSRVPPVPAPRPVVPWPRPVAHGSGPLPTFTPAPAPAAPGPVPAARAPRPTARAPRPTARLGPPARPDGRRSRRGRRTSLVAAGIGAVASAVVITSAFDLAGSSRPPVAVREVTPMAAGTSTGTAPQTSGRGGANQGPVSSGNEAAGLSRTQLATPPPLVGTAGGRNRVMFLAATQPLSPAQDPATTRNSAAGQPAGPGTSASPGTLQLSAGTVNVGTGSAGKITLTALDGAVRWSASSSAPDQVSLSSTAGTLAAGQSVTLAVTVTRGAPAGSATLTFDSAASASQLVLLTWSAPPGSGPVTRPVRHRHPHPHPHPHPTPSASAPSPSPTSASPSDTTVPDPPGS